MGEAPMDQNRQRLAVQMRFGVLSVLEQFLLSGQDLLGSVLSRSIMQEVQCKSAQMTPHFHNAWMHLIPSHVEHHGTGHFQECINLLK